MRSAIIIDGYVDEPAVLGVPPYVSTYPRYIAGTLFLKDFDVRYTTIDEVRKKEQWDSFNEYDVLVIISGVTVPGRYIGGTPITLKEIEKIFSKNKKPFRILTGAVLQNSREVLKNIGADEFVEDFIEYAFETNNYEIKRTVAVEGARIVKYHPRFPDIICEIEVSLGCERKNYCTFCSEPILHKGFSSRPLKDIVDEIEALYKAGVKAFRLGRSANILAYGMEKNSGKVNNNLIYELYNSIRNVAPQLEVLHTDNANPAFIARNYPEIVNALETIVKYNTEGDVLSFGVESFDPYVRKRNNIDGTVEEIDFAIKIVNEIGKVRTRNGIPKLLPGLNFIFGLPGEKKRSYEILYEKLNNYLCDNILIRRINLRQVIVVPETPLWFYSKRKKIKFDHRLFKHYKYLIRNKIDIEMIKRVFPIGTRIKNVIPEYHEGKLTFARPLGTYPILVGIPAHLDKKRDILVVGYGPRSLTGIRADIKISEATMDELMAIPGIGRKTAETIKAKAPESLVNTLLGG
ncbi:radical SAM protein [Thermosipho ferrireducens]|uniref:Radical SAM protein n=1 Tax=Thermosipho ferrireducens TaxID=2571116 RepID=A0ABX7S766_9BACT|nr:radical SAM protein [Thermosipho ferrireducens]QTA38443.1 radical SAM protein [Thermosipho ferrireducens]